METLFRRVPGKKSQQVERFGGSNKNPRWFWSDLSITWTRGPTPLQDQTSQQQPFSVYFLPEDSNFDVFSSQEADSD